MSESMSDLELQRVEKIVDYLKDNDFVTSAVVASELLDVQIKTASRLLSEAERLGLLISEGRTKDKRFRLVQ